MSSELIDRDALERIIQRAAELQTGEREIGDGLTEEEVLKLGAEVGIPDRYLKQALVEERVVQPAPVPSGLIAWLAGPQCVQAERVVARTVEDATDELDAWMKAEEGLATLRRSGGYLRWERQKGFMAEVRISLSAGGRAFALTKVDDVLAEIEPLEEGYCHIRLTANLTRRRTGKFATAAVGLVAGAGLSSIWLALGFAAPVAVIPIALAMGLSVPFLRQHRFQHERMRLALERVLDRLEGNPLTSKHALDLIDRVASEIRKGLKP